ncbi:MAG: succinyl-diaminopimelate desuccinylase [Alphaproteobacteria bacterium]|nr:succinyl-diaminopimelate desuccinylase [Alphaproteobacteria bacterium]
MTGHRVDPLELARAMIRCNSVTPADGGTLDRLQAVLIDLGFCCERLPFSEPGTDTIDNLYARRGDGGRHFCFAGHSDVVPVGDRQAWTVDPFGAVVAEGYLFGRGAADMKTAIACFTAAVDRFLARRGGSFAGSISLLITGDEEGPSINGTKKVLEFLAARGERIDACLVGEPTNPERLGEMIKIGRRGSVTGQLRVFGAQGHVAYPHLADNPIPRLLRMLSAIAAKVLDTGTKNFQPSNLEVTSIDVGNPASNVIPAEARATFNIRFNDRHTSQSLVDWLNGEFAAVGGRYEFSHQVTGEAFLTPPGPLSDLISRAVERRLGVKPAFSTTGGTSDARFIRNYAPVAEFGMVGQTMHKVDERARLSDIAALTDIYGDILDLYFANR